MKPEEARKLGIKHRITLKMIKDKTICNLIKEIHNSLLLDQKDISTIVNFARKIAREPGRTVVDFSSAIEFLLNNRIRRKRYYYF